jgi:hypothetical protein
LFSKLSTISAISFMLTISWSSNTKTIDLLELHI